MPLRTIIKGLALIGLTALAACTSGQSAVEPTVSVTSIPTVGKLQFAVGVATLNRGATTVTGLNVVTTYRQSNGLAAVLLNTPTLSGPAGFAVPAAPVGPPPANFACGPFSGITGVAGPDCPGTDAGTNTIRGTLPSSTPGAAGTSAVATTFGVTGGVFAYGFQPANTTNTTITNNEAGGSRYVPFSIPFYDPSDRRTVVGGPPAYVNFRDGTYPAAPTFIGFNQGFTPFMGVTLATGSYNLSVTVPSSPTSNTTVTAPAATLSSVTNSIGVYPVPAGIVRDGSGGFTVTIAPPAGVTETIVNVTDTGTADGTNACHTTPVPLAPPYYYSAVVPAGSTSATFPANTGPIDPAGKQTPTACAGDRLAITAYGFNYRAYESGVGLPGQTALPQTPTLTGSNGQADVSISPTLSVVY